MQSPLRRCLPSFPWLEMPTSVPTHMEQCDCSFNSQEMTEMYSSHTSCMCEVNGKPHREVGIKQPARRVDSLRDLLLDTRHIAQCFQICASAPWPCPVSWAKSTLILIPPVLGTLFSWPSLAVFSAHGSPSFQVWHSHTIDSRSTFQKEADTQLNLEDNHAVWNKPIQTTCVYSCLTRES